MKNPKIFAGWLNGTWTQIKAYTKDAALDRFNELNKSGTPIKKTDISWQKGVINSHQEPVEDR